MAVSAFKFKCSFANIANCRTICFFKRTTLSPTLKIMQCRNIGLMVKTPVGFHSRVFSSCTLSNTGRPRPTSFHKQLPLSAIRAKPVCINPLHSHHILCQYSQPYLFQSFTQSDFSRTYSTEKQPQECEKKPSSFSRFKQMYRDYWYVLVPVHAVTSLAWFGGFYYLLKSGVDVVGILESYEISERIIGPLRDSSAGYLAVSYAMYKILTPIRYTVTLGGTTLSINYLKKWGYIRPRPMPSREKLQEMYQEKRDNLKERRENIMHSVRGTKDGIRERKNNIIKSVQDTTNELKVKTDFLKEKTVKNSREEGK